MKKTSWLAVVVTLLGCNSSRLELDPEWRPLEVVIEADIPLVSDTAITTIGRTIFVKDLDAWLLDYPVGSTQFRALLMHERAHSQRQADNSLWYFNYLADKDFRWEEEKLGWELEIRHLAAMGVAQQPEVYAAMLANNYSNMVSYQEALEWVRSLFR